MAPSSIKKAGTSATQTKRTARRQVKSAATVASDDDFTPPKSKPAPKNVRPGSTSPTKATSTASKVTIFSTPKLRPSDPVPSTQEILEISSDEGGEVDELEDDDLADFIVDDEAVEDDEFESEDEDDDGTALIDGDDLFPEPTVPKTVRLFKRTAPTTPPLLTRSSAASSVNQPEGSPLGRQSPTKKQRTEAFSNAEFSTLGDPFTPVKKNTSTATRREPPDVDGNAGSVPVSKSKARARAKGKAVPTHASESLLDQLVGAVETGDDQTGLGSANASNFLDDLAGAVENGVSTLGSETVYLDDLSVLTVKALPTECEVTNLAAQDQPLAAKGFYNNLPNLTSIQQEFNRVPKVPKAGPGHINFSSLWKGFIPGFPVKTGLRSLLFTIDGDYVNLSRANPLELCAKQLYGLHPKYEISTKRRTPAICLSPVMVTESFTQTLNSSLPYSGHYLTGIFHSQEWSRCFSVIGMLTHQSAIWTNMWDDALKFATKTSSSQDSAGSGLPSSSQGLPPGAFNSASSPSKATSSKAGSSSQPHRKLVPLAYGEHIPVYDARGQSFTYDAATFDNLGKLLPLLSTEIPPRSFAVVAYLTQVHVNKAKASLYNYPMWVLLIASPP